MKTKLNKDILVKIAIGGALAGLVISIIAAIPLLNLILCCFCFLIPVIGGAFGYYTVKEHGIKSEEMSEGLMVGAIGGGLSGLTYGIVSGVINAIVSILYSLFDVTVSQSDNAAASLIGSGAGSIIGMILAPFMYGFIFAIAGLIGGLIATNMNKEAGGTTVKVEEVK